MDEGVAPADAGTEALLASLLRLAAAGCSGAYLRVPAWRRTLTTGVAVGEAVTTTLHGPRGVELGELGVWPASAGRGVAGRIAHERLVDDAARLGAVLLAARPATPPKTDAPDTDAPDTDAPDTDATAARPTAAEPTATEPEDGEPEDGGPDDRPDEPGTVTAVVLRLGSLDQAKEALGPEGTQSCLDELARRLRHTTGGQGSLEPYGDNGFALLVEGPISEPEALGLAERLISTARRPITVGGKVVALSGRAGIAAQPRGPGASGTAVQRAAEAAHTLDDSTGTSVAWFGTALRDELRRAQDVGDELRQALSLGALDVAFQPAIELTTGRIVGFEALARWRRPSGEPVPPAEFVAIAEQHGMVAELDAQVLRTALRQFAGRLGDAATPGTTPAVLWVNCSALNLTDELAGTVARALHDTGVPAHLLGLEIPEGSLIGDLSRVRAALERVRELGVRLAIDDFGTGSASFTVLTTLNAEVLKIDKSFIDPLDRDASSEMIIRAAIALAHARGMSVVAEGVETHEQAARLYRLGCDAAQGFLWARPGSLLASDGVAPDRLTPRVTSPLVSPHSRHRGPVPAQAS